MACLQDRRVRTAALDTFPDLGVTGMTEDGNVPNATACCFARPPDLSTAEMCCPNGEAVSEVARKHPVNPYATIIRCFPYLMGNSGCITLFQSMYGNERQIIFQNEQSVIPIF